MTTVIRYSAEFQKRVLEELSSGRFTSLSACARHYGIAKYETVLRWIRREGALHLLPVVKVIHE